MARLPNKKIQSIRLDPKTQTLHVKIENVTVQFQPDNGEAQVELAGKLNVYQTLKDSAILLNQMPRLYSTDKVAKGEWFDAMVSRLPDNAPVEMKKELAGFLSKWNPKTLPTRKAKTESESDWESLLESDTVSTDASQVKAKKEVKPTA